MYEDKWNRKKGAEIKIFFHGKETQTLEENMDCPTKKKGFW